MTGIPDGPHKGQEVELLLQGCKPVALFTNPTGTRMTDYLRPLDEAAAHGLLLKYKTTSPQHRVFYAQLSKAADMEELIAIYKRLDADSLKDGGISPSPADHKRIGELLGYSAEDITSFLQLYYQRENQRQNQRRAPQPA